MNTKITREYHRPFMVVEQFKPNEFVAGCVKGNGSRLTGLYCLDFNNDGDYDSGEDRNTGSDYLGHPHNEMVLNGNFTILEQGRYVENGGLGYMYVGSTNFNYNGSYDYSGNDFVPLLYAKVSIQYQYYTHQVMIFYADDGTGTISNAS